MSKPILIIDDDPDILDLLSEIVNFIGIPAVKKLDVIPLAELASINPRLVLLDHWLRSGYGVDYCQEIKANPSTKHIKVIMVSAVGHLEAVSNLAQADDYITKPFDIEILEQVIRKNSL